MVASARHGHKRHGKHQRHTKDFLKVYTPYLPMLVILLFGLVITIASPPQHNKNVLAYAASMSANDLLQATNNKRVANGKASLKLNSKLNSAAQAKANDMKNRNYWSHDTPGCPVANTCWYSFVNSSGYKYAALAENLAYGYSNASTTVDGWMGSPSHKTNMLNGTYTEVGFGYVNASSYVGDGGSPPGPQTIVVAAYAKPAATSSSPPAVASTQTNNTSSSQSAKTSQPTQTTTPSKTVTPPVAATETKKEDEDTPIVATTASTEPPSQSTSRLSTITGANWAWVASAAAVLSIIGAGLLISRHAYALHKLLRQGERYVMHHFVFDLTIISLIGVTYIANQTVGYIR